MESIDAVNSMLSEYGIDIQVVYCPVVFGEETPWQIDAALPDDREECGHQHIVRLVESYARVIEELSRLLHVTHAVVGSSDKAEFSA